jgi:hypothetical protein
MKRTDRLVALSPMLGVAAFLLVAVMAPQVSPRRGDDGELAQGVLWTGRLRSVDRALADGNVMAAETAWQEARRHALRSRGWEAMLDLGDASRRIGQRGGFPGSAEAKARTAYLTALFRARDRGSLDGALRAAEAFTSLGDWEVAALCARVADGLAGSAQDAQAHQHHRAFKERWGRELGGAAGPALGVLR